MRNKLQVAVDRLAENLRDAEETINDRTAYSMVQDEARKNIPAFNTALAALRDALQRQPDPETGLMPCGCGGRAVFDSAYGDDEVESSYTAEVYCELCEIRTPIFRENADVKAAWNRAMGYTAPPRPGAIGPDAGEMAPNGDEGATE